MKEKTASFSTGYLFPERTGSSISGKSFLCSFPSKLSFDCTSDFHNGSNVHRWHQKDGDDAYLFINEGCDPKFNDVNWNKYVEWGLFELAANYLRLIVAQIEKNDGGILIHCISGWDRTPLFVFLVRALAWSEGKHLVRQSIPF